MRRTWFVNSLMGGRPDGGKAACRTAVDASLRQVEDFKKSHAYVTIGHSLDLPKPPHAPETHPMNPNRLSRRETLGLLAAGPAALAAMALARGRRAGRTPNRPRS